VATIGLERALLLALAVVVAVQLQVELVELMRVTVAQTSTAQQHHQQIVAAVVAVLVARMQVGLVRQAFVEFVS